jgi:NDP-sugar pyrophosphorylase family protein
MERVTALLLCGGLGTRLRTVVSDKPKVLAPVAGRPFVTYLLDQLAEAGVNKAVLSTGYLASQIEEELGTEYQGITLTYAQEDEPLGTGGAIRFGASHANPQDDLIVMNGDSYINASIADAFAFHQQESNDATIVLVEVEDASRFGTVAVDDEQRVTDFLEKQEGIGRGAINSGIYLISAKLIADMPEGKSSIERDVFPRWLKDWTVKGYTTAAEFIDIGVPESYSASHAFMEKVGRA